MLSRTLVELEAVSVADSARGQGLGCHLVEALVRVLSPGAPLDLQLPVGQIRFPPEPWMRHLVRPLVRQVSYRAGALGGLLAGR
ncbi:hypothetical protein [Streptomyces sp. NBC_01601]|uniref:hypothetical protein n=1 Tax=Streptomyces sp. NBC_01601 TaxID=2975892 RepID=UPI002E2C08AF|nr:hypothetical protein [Streptomyces sp. NBC_01601]